jgi:hypothetical protein
MTVGAEDTKVHKTVISWIAVDVVKLEGERFPVPLVVKTTTSTFFDQQPRVEQSFFQLG